jgi:rhamnogalacturonyl hydrolase YesR
LDAINAQVELIRTVALKTMGWKFRIWGFGEGIALRGLYQATSVTGDSTFRDHVDGLLEVYVNRGVGIAAEEHCTGHRVAPALPANW